MSTTYRPRSAWTTAARGGATLTAAQLVGLAVHYPGRAQPYGLLTEAQEAAILRGIRDWHTGNNGWSDIGYQVAIGQAGRVWDCRGISRVPAAHASAANPDANREWGAVLLLVGNDEDLAPALVEAFRDFRHRVWLARWPRTVDVRGHDQVPGAVTSCPGPKVLAAIAEGTLTATPGLQEDEMSFEDTGTRPRDGAEITYGDTIMWTENKAHTLLGRTSDLLAGQKAILAHLAGEDVAAAAERAAEAGARAGVRQEFAAAGPALAEELRDLGVTPEKMAAALRTVLGSVDDGPT